MPRPLSSLVPEAADLIAMEVPALGGVLLTHLKSYEGVSGNIVFQNGLISQSNFISIQEDTGHGRLLKEPEYGDKQREVNRALMEAWNWLEKDGLLIRDYKQTSPWFAISRRGEEFLSRSTMIGDIDRVLSEAPQARRDGAWWSRAKHLIELCAPAKSGEAKAAEELFFSHLESVGKGASERRRGENRMVGLLNEAMQSLSSGPHKVTDDAIGKSGHSTLVADSRLTELRELAPSDFDFKRLIRLCEELNTAYQEGCYLATAMLTRALLDHVPPVFAKNTFTEVASNYGGGKSFRDAMQHLENASRKIADSILHTPIRKSEILPTAQQVNCAQQLDLLLSEIIRITQ
jgi:hypothetical protein